MEGTGIRLSRFTAEGARMLDLTQGAGPAGGFSAYVVYPELIPRLLAEVPAAARAPLLLRVTAWDGAAVTGRFDPEAAAFHGCGGCFTDLAAGFGDEAEIESLRILAAVVEGARPLGLPVVCRVFLGPEVEGPDAAAYLEVPLTIAEEMGADCLVVPGVAPGVWEKARRPLVPCFFPAEAGMYERGPR